MLTPWEVSLIAVGEIKAQLICRVRLRKKRKKENMFVNNIWVHQKQLGCLKWENQSFLLQVLSEGYWFWFLSMFAFGCVFSNAHTLALHYFLQQCLLTSFAFASEPGDWGSWLSLLCTRCSVLFFVVPPPLHFAFFLQAVATNLPHAEVTSTYPLYPLSSLPLSSPTSSRV